MPLLEKLIATIAPFDCQVCGQEGTLLCSACRKVSLQLAPNRCYRCWALSPISATCTKCRQASSIRRVWAGAYYQETARQLVKPLKFERAQATVAIMAEQIALAMPTEALTTEVVVVHAPMASSRVRERGYDQSKLLAAARALKQAGAKQIDATVFAQA